MMMNKQLLLLVSFLGLHASVTYGAALEPASQLSEQEEDLPPSYESLLPAVPSASVAASAPTREAEFMMKFNIRDVGSPDSGSCEIAIHEDMSWENLRRGLIKIWNEKNHISSPVSRRLGCLELFDNASRTEHLKLHVVNCRPCEDDRYRSEVFIPWDENIQLKGIPRVMALLINQRRKKYLWIKDKTPKGKYEIYGFLLDVE